MTEVLHCNIPDNRAHRQRCTHKKILLMGIANFQVQYWVLNFVKIPENSIQVEWENQFVQNRVIRKYNASIG